MPGQILYQVWIAGRALTGGMISFWNRLYVWLSMAVLEVIFTRRHIAYHGWDYLISLYPMYTMYSK